MTTKWNHFGLGMVLLITVTACTPKKKESEASQPSAENHSASSEAASTPTIIPSDTLIAYQTYLQQEHEYLERERRRLLEEEPVVLLGKSTLEEIMKNASDSKAYDYYFRLFEEVTIQHGELLLEYNIWLKQVLPDSTLKEREVNLQPYFRIKKLQNAYKSKFEELRKQYENWLYEMKRKYHPPA
jgi:hypothetical protein